jgi:hypothetical protein
MASTLERGQEHVVRPSHVAYGKELFTKIWAVVKNADIDFEQIEFRIFGPNLNTLQKQNEERLESFVKTYRQMFGDTFLLGRKDIRSFAIQNNPTKIGEKRGILFEEIQNSPQTLFLLICDEAHHGATRLTGEFVNDDMLRCSANVVTLFVSATPYNLLTAESQILDNNVVTWENYELNQSEQPAGVEEGGNMPYRGLPFFQERLCDRLTPQNTIRGGSLCEADKEFQDKLESQKKLSKGRKGANKSQFALSMTIVSEFVDALALCVEREIPKENPEMGKCQMYPQRGVEMVQKSMTHRMVQDLVNMPVQNKCGKGCLVVLRQPNKTGEFIATAIRDARDKLGLMQRFAVLTDLNESVGGSNLDTYFRTHNAAMFDRLASSNSGDDAHAPPRFFGKYEDLEGISCILILCQKGKMGA